MTALELPPGGWAPNMGVFGAQWSALTPDVQQVAIDLAVREVWALSGRQFGTWSVVLAPFLKIVRPTWIDDPYYGVPGYLFDSAAGTVSGGVGVVGPTRVFRLPGPVVSVEQVMLDGVALVLGDGYALDAGGKLARLNGGPAGTVQAGWPIAQDVYNPTWTVTYTRGRPVTPDANMAAARMAVAVGKALTVPDTDKLPGRVRDVTRGNTVLGLIAPDQLADAGLTGIPLVDAWLRAVNPNKLAQAASIWSPDRDRHRVISVTPTASAMAS